MGVSSPQDPVAPVEPAPLAGDRFASMKEGQSLRQHAASGTMVNAAFNVGLTSLGFIKSFVLVAFLTPADYGVWGILLVSLGTLTWLKQVGITDKYVQQDEADQELAFQRAFTMELIVNSILLVLLLIAVPVVAIAYNNTSLLWPGFAMCALLPAGQLQVPFWVLYRRMEYRRQRLLQAIDPIVALLVTIVLAALGAGYWALVFGTLAGSWTGAFVAQSVKIYPQKLRYDRGTLKEYWTFSAPLFVASVGGIIIAQVSVAVGNAALGLAGAGAITLASQISQLAQRVDDVVTSTLYPAICAVSDRVHVLYETFEKSNRLALMWAMPFGIGLALFSSDLVSYVIGERWRNAVPVIAAAGAGAALSQLGFNWTSYMRALGNTRPIMINALAQAAALCVSAPLMFWLEDYGYAACIAAMIVTTLVVRAYYLQQLFKGFALYRHAFRALLPSVPAVAVVLGARLADSAVERDAGVALSELCLYASATIVATWFFERDLLEEAVGYLRRRRTVPA